MKLLCSPPKVGELRTALVMLGLCACAPTDSDRTLRERCSTDAQCQSGLCRGGGCAVNGCGGDVDCPTGLVCQSDSSGRTCAPPAARGDFCARSDALGPVSLSCEDGLVCEATDDDATRVCAPSSGPRALREACDAARLCDLGLLCIDGVCLADVDAACRIAGDCASLLCPDSLAVCVVNDCGGDVACGQGLVCAGGDCGRECLPPAKRDEECLYGRTDTDPCFRRHGCADGLLCEAVQIPDSIGACVPASGRAAGELCRSDEVCASGVCTNTACQ